MGARILPLQESEVREDVQNLYREVRNSFGIVPNLFKTIAHKPDVLLALYPFATSLLSDNSLSAKVKELAILTTSKTNRCHYCVVHHTEMGKKVGLTQEQIDSISDCRDSDLFNQEEKTVIQYAEQVTKDAEAVSDELFSKLKGFYSDQQIVLLTLIIGLFQIFNKFNGALQVELEKD